MQIYLVEDDMGLARGMKFTLEKEGYQVELFASCQAVRKALKQQSPRLVLLDWNLPDGDGLELCREIKAMWDIPVLMITARDLELDQVMCLEGGADDYIAKPFSLSILKARILALLRRSGSLSEAGRMLRSGNICINEKDMKAYKADTELECSLTEFRLLKFLMENKDQVLLKEQILSKVWDAQGMFVEENTLTVNIRRLRLKIEEDPANPRYIKTIYGMGYMWEDKQP